MNAWELYFLPPTHLSDKAVTQMGDMQTVKSMVSCSPFLRAYHTHVHVRL